MTIHFDDGIRYGSTGATGHREPPRPHVEPDPAVEGCAWYLVGEPGGMWVLTQWHLETGEVQPPGPRTAGPFETAPDACQWAGDYVAHETFSWNMLVWQRCFRVEPAEVSRSPVTPWARDEWDDFED